MKEGQDKENHDSVKQMEETRECSKKTSALKEDIIDGRSSSSELSSDSDSSDSPDEILSTISAVQQEPSK